MGRFDDRLSHPLPDRRQSARMLRTALASQPWRPLGAAGVPVAPDPQPLQEDGVQWLGHATSLLVVDGVRILTDPVFGRLGPVPRAHPAPLPPESLRPDVVLISHDHRDHLDRRAAHALRDAAWRVPLGTAAWCRRQGIDDVEEFDWGDETVQAEPEKGDRPSRGEVRLRFVGADHWCRRGANDTNQRLWGGWRVDGSWSAYFAGDTGNGPRYQAVLAGGAPDLALLPIGGCEPRWFMQHKHLNPEDVASSMAAWPGTAVVPIHWGTYRIAIERLDSVLHRLRAGWVQQGRDPRRLHPLPVGGCLLRTSF